MAVLIIVLISIGVMVGMYALQGWVLSILWGWFMMPLFHLPPITILQAIGVAMVVGLLTGATQKTAGSSKERRVSLVTGISSPLVILLIGWIVHSIM